MNVFVYKMFENVMKIISRWHLQITIMTNKEKHQILAFQYIFKMITNQLYRYQDSY